MGAARPVSGMVAAAGSCWRGRCLARGSASYPGSAHLRVSLVYYVITGLLTVDRNFLSIVEPVRVDKIAAVIELSHRPALCVGFNCVIRVLTFVRWAGDTHLVLGCSRRPVNEEPNACNQWRVVLESRICCEAIRSHPMISLRATF